MRIRDNGTPEFVTCITGPTPIYVTAIPIALQMGLALPAEADAVFMPGNGIDHIILGTHHIPLERFVDEHVRVQVAAPRERIAAPPRRAASQRQLELA